MKETLFVLMLSASVCQAQEASPTFRVHLATSLGLGISGRASQMTGGALMASLALPLEFRNQWYIIPEVYGGAFRSPKYPNKVGYFLESYPRLRHEAYGIRLGKGIKSNYPEVSMRISVGANLLLVHEPCCFSSGKFYSYYDEVLYRTYSVPVQFDARFRLSKKERSFLVLTGRWDTNGHRPFGSLNAGLETRLFALRKPSPK